MRSLLLVKNKRGEIKFSHYSNTETSPDADIAYLTDFIKHGDKLIALENMTIPMCTYHSVFPTIKRKRSCRIQSIARNEKHDYETY